MGKQGQLFMWHYNGGGREGCSYCQPTPCPCTQNTSQSQLETRKQLQVEMTMCMQQRAGETTDISNVLEMLLGENRPISRGDLSVSADLEPELWLIWIGLNFLVQKRKY